MLFLVCACVCVCVWCVCVWCVCVGCACVCVCGVCVCGVCVVCVCVCCVCVRPISDVIAMNSAAGMQFVLTDRHSRIKSSSIELKQKTPY